MRNASAGARRSHDDVLSASNKPRRVSRGVPRLIELTIGAQGVAPESYVLADHKERLIDMA